jgi:hypothetical protein
MVKPNVQKKRCKILREGWKLFEESEGGKEFSLRELGRRCGVHKDTAGKWWNRRHEFERTGKLLRKTGETSLFFV